MARGTGKPTKTFRMTPLGDRGPTLRPELDYFSVALVAVHLPGSLLNTSKFAPIVWSSVKYLTMDGEKALIGLFPTADSSRPEFARNDRVEVMDLQLTPRIIAREELTVEFTLGAVKEKDYLAGALTLVTELATSPAAAFISQIVPHGAAVKGAVQGATETIDKLSQNLNALLDNDKVKSLGRFISTLRAPLPSGLVAFVDDREDLKNLTFDPKRNALVASNGPVKSAYAVLRLQSEPTRPDWMILPDLNQAWARIREAALNGGDVAGAIELFRITAVTSPDLTHADAQRLVEAAHQKFASVMAGSESAMLDDPGDMGESLSFFMPSDPDTATESAELGGSMGQAAAAALGSSRFARALEIILAHEGGYVDHPKDPGGATNKGITQKTYNAFRSHKGQPKRSVKDIDRGELEELYFNGYWLPARCHEMPNEALALLMFDAAVNHGPQLSIKLLQQAAGVPDRNCDGMWGAATRTRVITAAASANALVDACLLKRERYYRRIVDLNPKLGAFLRGWMNRLTSLRQRLQPLLARAPSAGDSETALYEDDNKRVPLVAADPDFSDWKVRAAPIDIAAQ